ncbi:MAG: HAD family hydrolase [Victivallales bacterium]|nr:HAD family hydrolase [Victivallales bacterium]
MKFAFQAVIFDLDGTLLNTVPAILRTSNLTLQAFSLPPIGEAEVKRCAGDGVAKLVERFLKHSGGEEAYQNFFSRACQTYLDFFATNCMHGVLPYPGMMETLQALHQAGLKLAVLTNKPQDRAEDNIFGLFGHEIFDTICGITPQRTPKPDATTLRELLSQWDLLPTQCLYVGDTNTDMLTAQNAAMPKAGALWGFRDREELSHFQPEYLVEQPADLLPIVIQQ